MKYNKKIFFLNNVNKNFEFFLIFIKKNLDFFLNNKNDKLTLNFILIILQSK